MPVWVGASGEETGVAGFEVDIAGFEVDLMALVVTAAADDVLEAVVLTGLVIIADDNAAAAWPLVFACAPRE